MKMNVLFFCLIFSITSQLQAQSVMVSPKEVLKGKYEAYLKNNLEYLHNLKLFKEAQKDFVATQQKIDSLKDVVKNSDFTPYLKKESIEILELAANNHAGDVYLKLRINGPDFTLALNDLICIREIYQYERELVQAQKDIKLVSKWSQKMADIIEENYESMLEAGLSCTVREYENLKKVEYSIDEALKKFIRNDYKISGNEANYQNLYYSWGLFQDQLKSNSERDRFFNALQKEFGHLVDLSKIDKADISQL
ncbi:hypothetical protein [Flexithrix dorotheae]|uniref:hypothetical protein n=1 Tax=Flexithrix dorotheae TaxID=70993 RepID=UPI0012FB9E7B|nr:hypothetical protein [Flexithrix dorotheae]